jgi:catechol 2,3-dioxygenase-like lactoylglutathione lyase family enzyme
MQPRLSRVILFAANMDQMVAFYRDVLGFKLQTNDKVGGRTRRAAARDPNP